ncbi:pyrroloquinoline quinone biosynthesis protein PqqF [Pseudomonas sp. HLS-6]|uniref:pyrroloquinoline quinone biosynthesis protein PqqF n=1 Tax=Pseudomonas sp. HLS-6 TaxID=2049589 RepID=UPI000C1965A1|nr:pyrroloquinoline quinone biosynthesis protein PqqF [Pseudomonas sp. HLS-6]ATR85069.1 pyrroloquinoline quinone biosynthesis protein PqqF [Pseudomonas sp. HLS-6]
MPATFAHHTLANGLQLTLRHAPHLKRCAAAVHVAAGSHDAPTAWPGLAHFLEHLFFLGNSRFPAEDGLMRYVQRHGGQVNASTRERATEFFFEVPVAAFSGALERLCDMLAQPRLDDHAAQLREREVLHAEFIAWSRDRASQAQFTLLQCVSAGHPLRAFHAGNRYSLGVQQAAFQRALQDFHKRYYQAGQITLSLAGPQPLTELLAMAEACSQAFDPGLKTAQAPVTPLQLCGAPAQPAGLLNLLFACERLPTGSEDAIAFLSTWLTDSQPGSLLALLREKGWITGLSFKTLYQYEQQALLHGQFTLTDEQHRSDVERLFFDWLAFFNSADRTPLLEEYARLLACQQGRAGALQLARQDSTGNPPGTPDSAALSALLNPLLARTCPRLETVMPWQLPEPNPFLVNADAATRASSGTPHMVYNPVLPSTRQTGILYLRWQLDSRSHDDLYARLNGALQRLIERAAQACVELEFSACAHYWQLRCAGAPSAVNAVVTQALAVLRSPPASTWQTATTPAREPTLIPIRQLLRQLPEVVLGGGNTTPQVQTATDAELQAVWSSARWQGLATGFAATERQPLAIPGSAGSHTTPRLIRGRQWYHSTDDSAEQALLLFCPVADEAAGRLLAHLIQGPFYQRLRVELQLGYAVFSAFRQVQGHAGLLFGVQSPSVSNRQILMHINTFIDGPGVWLNTHASELEAQRQALAAQFAEPSMSNSDVAEWAWQAQLAGHPQQTLKPLQARIRAVDLATLEAAAEAVRRVNQGWLCLANGPAPSAAWQDAC